MKTLSEEQALSIEMNMRDIHDLADMSNMGSGVSASIRSRVNCIRDILKTVLEGPDGHGRLWMEKAEPTPPAQPQDILGELRMIRTLLEKMHANLELPASIIF